MIVLTLYSRDDCCLCDEAIAILADARAPDFRSVWIDGKAELEDRYGIRIPVLRDDSDGRELDWPFDAATVQVFLQAGQASAKDAKDAKDAK